MNNLTESYCERCGAHYVFDAEPRVLSVKSARIFAKGLRNFVMNDGQSFGDSMEVARNEDGGEASERLTDAFHRTFNFCMSCRQYACEKCWNARQGACLSCAPDPDVEPRAPEDRLIVRTATTDSGGERPAGSAAAPNAEVAPSAEAASDWPAADLAEILPAPAETLGPRPAGKAPEWLARSTSADGEATGEQISDPWTLWPITDALAPEATLTPEELSLVRSKLSSAGEEVRPDTAQALPIYEGNAAAVESAETTAEAEPATRSTAEVAGFEVEAEPAVEPTSEEPSPEPAVGSEQAAAELAAAAEQLEPTAATEQPHAAAEQSTEERPIATRLLSRFMHSGSTQPQQATVEPPTTPPSTPAGEPWPHATPWLDRPIKATAWQIARESSAPAGQPRTETVQAPSGEAATPEPVTIEAASPETALVEAAASEPVASAAELPVLAPELVVDEGTWAAPNEQKAPTAVAPEPAGAAKPTALEPAAPEPTVAPEAPRAPEPALTQLPLAAAPAALPRQTPPQPEVAPLPVDQPGTVWPGLGLPWPSPLPRPSSDVWSPPTSTAPSPAFLSARAAAAAGPSPVDMWAQSAQEVINHGSVRVCHHCGLPVSTHARFCRRCGTSQL